ncbi:mitochondrial ribosomal protein S25 (m25) [Andalucia godoyi]|uniref:Mitochondrial ribosomal protein S25 (M25) n=1 Tax=Andalucia godoyi TaxID=505711 RepID=A0A8K0F129_ANDGO|nr:mitochondrial ribosomal protein S25 (m25) [Andalucia godoyi]|eukprot:ANDGO_07531.mRNA.1 mitochondrial ribosomal protein S25 (m25)
MSAGRLSIPRTLEYLVANKVQLPSSIQSVQIVYAKKGAGNTGARKFLYEFLAPLRFHNPNVALSPLKSTAANAEAQLKVTFTSGAEQVISVKGKTSSDIVQSLLGIKA